VTRDNFVGLVVLLLLLGGCHSFVACASETYPCQDGWDGQWP
jgi:hypothetical protein